MKQQKILFAAIALAGAGLSASNAYAQQAGNEFVIASWGGSYAQAQTRAIFQPYATTEGLELVLVDYPGDPRAVDFQLAMDTPVWDIIDLEMHDTAQLCDRGALEPIAAIWDLVDPEGFIDGSIQTCGLGNAVWTTGIAYAPAVVDPAASELGATAFFDPTVPGRRAASRSAPYLMELAVLATGTTADQLYTRLGSERGVAEALAQLDAIADQITWTDNRLQAYQEVEAARASFALTVHFLPARASVSGDASLGFLWSNHLFEMDSFAMIRGTDSLDDGISFLAASSQPAYQGAMATLSTYGPANLKALDFVSQSILPWMPHAQGNREGAIAFDAGFWESDAGARAAARFEAWLSGN